MWKVRIPVTSTPKAAVALLLTFAAGYVDVVGYIALFHIFTANMTGNTVHLATNLAASNLKNAGVTAGVLAAFVAGSIVGRSLIEIGARNGFRRIASLALVVETGLIVIVARSAPARTSALHATWLLLFLAAAMGLQTATLTRIGPLTVHTTFVTGMINKFCQLVSHALFLSLDVLRGREGVRVMRRQVTRRAAYIFSIWLLYLVGAMVGAQEESPLGMRSLFIPVAVLAAAIIVDQLWPLAVQEEQDQG